MTVPVLPEVSPVVVSTVYATFSCFVLDKGYMVFTRTAPFVPSSALLTFVVTMKSARTPAVLKSISSVESLIAVTVNKLLAKLQTVFGVIPEVPFEAES